MEEMIHVCTEEELTQLNPEGIEINMDLIEEDAQLGEEDLLQDIFNEDDINELCEGDLENVAEAEGE